MHVRELSVRDLLRVMIYTNIKILAHYSARINHLGIRAVQRNCYEKN